MEVMRNLFQALRIWALFLPLLAFNGPAWARSNSKVVVLDLHDYAGLERAQALYVSDLIRGVAARLPKDTYFVITRENILESLPPGTDLATCEGECEVETGRKIGADFVVSGEILPWGGQFKVSLKLHETITSSLLGSESAAGKDLAALERSVMDATAGLLARLPGASLAAFEGSARMGSGTVISGVRMDRGEDIVNELSDDSGFLVIRSKPEKATIFVNGEEVGSAPVHLERMVGRYVIVGEFGRLYHSARREVDLTTEGARVSLTLPKAYGSLRVDSSPAGAAVWLDGEEVGETPYRNAKKPSGSYALRVVLGAHLTHREQITIADGEDTHVLASLQSNYGALSVLSVPAGAEIVLNDEDTGARTPHSFGKLKPGVYIARLNLDGYGEVVAKATVERGQHTELSEALEAKEGMLSLMAIYDDGTPCEGTAYVNGEDVGTTPLKVVLPAKEHTIGVHCPQGKGIESIHVTHNEKKTLFVPIARSGHPASPRGDERPARQRTTSPIKTKPKKRADNRRESSYSTVFTKRPLAWFGKHAWTGVKVLSHKNDKSGAGLTDDVEIATVAAWAPSQGVELGATIPLRLSKPEYHDTSSLRDIAPIWITWEFVRGLALRSAWSLPLSAVSESWRWRSGLDLLARQEMNAPIALIERLGVSTDFDLRWTNIDADIEVRANLNPTFYGSFRTGWTSRRVREVAASNAWPVAVLFGGTFGNRHDLGLSLEAPMDSLTGGLHDLKLALHWLLFF